MYSAAATGSAGAVTVDAGALLNIATATYNLPSGGLTLGAGATLYTNSGMAVTINGGITLAGSIGVTVGSTDVLTVSGAIGDGSPSGGYGLSSSGRGTLILSGTSTYTGATTVNTGVLEVNGSIATSSGVSVASGATLDGSGTVPAVTAVGGGTVSAGNAASTGILGTGGLSLATDSTFNVVLGGTTAGTGYDQLNVTGTVNLDSDSLGGSSLNVSFAPGYTPSLGDSFVIVANSGGPIQGTFDGLPEGATIPIGGQNLEITYVGGTGNSIVLTDKAAPTINVTATANPSQFGQSVTFGVTVTGGGPTPTGTVTFYDGDPTNGGQQIGTPQPLSSGQASVPTSALAIGLHQIYAVYSGDPTYFSLTQTLGGGQNVTQDITATSLSSSQPSTTYGTEVVFTALVSQAFGGTPTGMVNFYDGATEIGMSRVNSIGIATFATTTLSASASPHSMNATYVGIRPRRPADRRTTRRRSRPPR